MFAASWRVIAENTFKPELFIISAASFELVPWSLTMIGILILPIFLYAWTTPFATRSHRTIPPKMFRSIVRKVKLKGFSLIDYFGLKLLGLFSYVLRPVVLFIVTHKNVLKYIL